MKRRSVRVLAAGVTVVAALLLGACGGGAGADGTETVTVAQAAPGLSFAPLYVADGMGYFADEGLAVDLQTLKPDVAVAGLASDQIDYVATIGSVARQAATGVPVKVAMVWFDRTPFVIMGNSRFQDMAALRGQAVGVSGFGSSTDVALRHALRASGLDPETDVEIIQLGGGGPAGRITAIQTDQVAATPLTLPDDIIAERRGLTRLYDTTDELLIPFTGLGVSDIKLAEDPEQIAAMIRATRRALEHMAAEPEESARIISEATGTEEDVVLEALPTMVRIVSPDGLASAEALENSIAPTDGSGATPDLATAYDFDLLRAENTQQGVPAAPDRPAADG